jgi:hypothetical protein
MRHPHGAPTAGNPGPDDRLTVSGVRCRYAQAGGVYRNPGKLLIRKESSVRPACRTGPLPLTDRCACWCDRSHVPSEIGSGDRRTRHRASDCVPPPPGGTLLVPIPPAGARSQGPRQALGIREPIGRVLGQAALHEALQIPGMSSRTSDGGTTGSRACAASSPIPSSPSNGGRPVSR